MESADKSSPNHSLVRWLFLRALGIVYLIAFASLWAQVDGLIGSSGVLPIREFLDGVRRQTGHERYWLLPTLCWLDPGDGFLGVLCGGGVLLSCLLILGWAPAPILVLLWAFYLSLTLAGQDFLGFQWDSLLLEAGLLSVFFAPLGLRPLPGREAPPSPVALWGLRWLLFRLMLSSGVVKLASGDAAWRGLTALRFHYETQPLPTWVGWYVHQLPGMFQTASVILTFVMELAVPFLVFAPRRLRLGGAAALVGFQLLIAATGNYCFFNLLTIVLCLLLLDDEALPRRWRAWPARTGAGSPAGRPWPRWLLAPVAAVILVISSAEMLGTLGLTLPWPRPVVVLYSWVAPFRSINSYGLFAVMTTRRPEIVVEGSRDGRTWLAYEFRWKPGDLARSPRFVAPYQPRLDWQMWFAALGRSEDNAWFVRFLLRLLDGSPQVTSLLERNPFGATPPRFVRAVLYDYRFTDLATRRAHGTWWRREPMGLYCPALSRTGEEPVEPMP